MFEGCIVKVEVFMMVGRSITKAGGFVVVDASMMVDETCLFG